MINKYLPLCCICLLFTMTILSSCERVGHSTVSSKEAEVKTGDSKDIEMTRAEITLAKDWSMHLLSVENSLQYRLWALGYAETAIDSCDWIDIQRALAVVETANINIDAQVPSDKEMTEETYNLLSSQYGEDVYMVMMACADEEELLHGIKGDMRILRYDLSDRLFLSSNISDIKEDIRLQKNYCDALLKYYAYATTYLTKIIPDCEKMLQTDIQNHHPLIFERLPKDDMDKEELENMGADELNSIEEYHKKRSKLLAIRKNEVIIYKEANRKNDLSILRNDSTQIKGADEYLPAPLWYSDDRAKIVWRFKNLDEELCGMPQIGQEIDDMVPSELNIFCDSVPKKDVLLFLTQLAEKGVVYHENKEVDSTMYTVTADEWSMDLKREGKNITMVVKGKIPCFVPFWHDALDERVSVSI